MTVELLQDQVVHQALLKARSLDLPVQLRVQPHPVAGRDDVVLRGDVPSDAIVGFALSVVEPPGDLAGLFR